MQKEFVKNSKSDRTKSGAIPAAPNERVASAATLALKNNNNNCSIAAPTTDTLLIQQTTLPPSQRPSASSVSTGAFILIYIYTYLLLYIWLFGLFAIRKVRASARNFDWSKNSFIWLV